MSDGIYTRILRDLIFNTTESILERRGWRTTVKFKHSYELFKKISSCTNLKTRISVKTAIPIIRTTHTPNIYKVIPVPFRFLGQTCCIDTNYDYIIFVNIIKYFLPQSK